MIETIRKETRKARKRHRCDYCSGFIKPGEIYEYAVEKCDELYEWKTHKKCIEIASALWDYIDPDEGMTQEDFQYGCTEFCHTFICPECKHYEVDLDDCMENSGFCLDKIHGILQTNDLRAIRTKPGFIAYALVPREKETDHAE